MAVPIFIKLAETGSKQFEIPGKHCIKEVFGETSPMWRRIGAMVGPAGSLLDDIPLSDLSFEETAEEDFTYTVQGKIQFTEDWSEYDDWIFSADFFTGKVSYCKGKTHPVDFTLEVLLNQSLSFERPRLSGEEIEYAAHAVLQENQLKLLLSNRVREGYGDDELHSQAVMMCKLRLSQLSDVEICYVLFRGNAWSFSAEFTPYLSVSGLMKLLEELFQVKDVAGIADMPEGIPGLDFFKLKGVTFALTQERKLRQISITLASGSKWSPQIPFLTLEDMGITLTFNWHDSLLQDGLDYLFTGGVFGTVSIKLSETKKMSLGAWYDFTGRNVQGELLVSQNADENKDVPLTSLLAKYGVPCKNVEGLTVAELWYHGSLADRSLFLSFESNFGESLSFSILGLRIAVTAAGGRFSYQPDRLALELHGQIEFGKTDPFTLSVSFDYDCEKESGWHFGAGLTGGEISVYRLLSELFLIEQNRENPVVDLKLTDLKLDFYSENRGPFRIQAQLEQPWQTMLLGTPMVLFGRIDLEKESESRITGCLEVGFRLNVFQVKGIYELIEEPNFLFQIFYGGAYLNAAYRKKQEHETLTLSLGGMTLGWLAEEFVHMVNPNADYKLAAPWDALNRISLDQFSLEFDFQDRTVSMRYALDLDIAGLVKIHQIGLVYSRNQDAGLKFILVGSLLSQEYTAEDPLSWDAVNDQPPAVGGTKAALLKLSYLGMGQHFGTRDLLEAAHIAEAIIALKQAMKPVQAGERPPLSYSEDINWLFGVDLTYKGMLRIQMVLNDPSLYGVLITVEQVEDSALSQLAGLSLELLYKKVTEEIGMFSADLTIPDRFRKFQFGVLNVTLGRFYMEIYTNGNFLLDLGFPHNRDFSRSFVIEAGYYTGRGGFYFGVLTGDTYKQLPRISNGTFDPVISIGIGISLGIGRSFDFAVVKGGVSLEAVAIFEGLFAVYTPLNAAEKKDFYYYAKAVLGLSGRLYLTVDFKIITISANAEISAYATVVLEAYRPMLFALDLDLKVGARIKILFIKISFSFHFSLHAEFTIGEIQSTPWKVIGQEVHPMLPSRYPPFCHREIGRLQPLKITALRAVDLCAQNEKMVIPIRLLPLYSVENPLLGSAGAKTGKRQESIQYCAAFLFTIDKGGNGFGKVVELAEQWIQAQLDTSLSVNDCEMLSALAKKDEVDYFSYFKERVTLLISTIPEDINEAGEIEGAFFPVVPALSWQWDTLDAEGKVTDSETVNFSETPVVSSAYIQQLQQYFRRLNPDKQTKEVQDQQEEVKNLTKELFQSYFGMVVQALLKELDNGLQNMTCSYNSSEMTLDDICRPFREQVVTVPCQKHEGEGAHETAARFGITPEELVWHNGRLNEQLELLEGGDTIFLQLGVTPPSVLLDNPQLRFHMEHLTIADQRYPVGGMTVEEVQRTYRITADAIARAVLHEVNVFQDQTVQIRTLPFLNQRQFHQIAASEETAAQIAGMVSRFFLQGIRVPKPNETERWDGLYGILGQQKRLLYVSEAPGDRKRHVLSWKAAEGYEDFIQTAGRTEITIGNQEIRLNCPSDHLVHVFRKKPTELEQFLVRAALHPFQEVLTYEEREKRKSILLFTEAFTKRAADHLQTYEWGIISQSRQLCSLPSAGEKGTFGALFSVQVKQLQRNTDVYEITGIDRGYRALLEQLKDAELKEMKVLLKPSSAQGMDTVLYPVELSESESYLIQTNLSRETKNRSSRDGQPKHTSVASFEESGLLLNLLWEESVTCGNGYYLSIKAEKEISRSLFSSSGEGEFWFLILTDEAAAGCSCILLETEIGADQVCFLQIKEAALKDHPEELTVQSTLEPGSAGFELEILQPLPEAADKESVLRNLFSMVNYQIAGTAYETAEGGLPILPADNEKETESLYYRQSIPLNRFLKSHSSNPYASVGQTAHITLEYRDVLGNLAIQGDGTPYEEGAIEITPVYNDALIDLQGICGLQADYRIWNQTLYLEMQTALEQSLSKEGRSQMSPSLQKAIDQLECCDVELWLCSSFLKGEQRLKKEGLIGAIKEIKTWVLWMDAAADGHCQAESFSAAADLYTLSLEELGAANLKTELNQIYEMAELSVPKYEIMQEGKTLSAIQAPETAEGNEQAVLHVGTDVFICAGEKRTYLTDKDVLETFQSAAEAIGCKVNSLVEANQLVLGILSETYVFTCQGYEVAVGAQDGITASLADVCETFRTRFQVDITPYELIAEEQEGILKKRISLYYEKLTPWQGETVEANHFGCTAQELWKWNQNTVNFLEYGNPVFIKMKPGYIKEGQSLKQFSDMHGIHPKQLLEANGQKQFTDGSKLQIPGRIVLPTERYTQSVILPERGGEGYSLEELNHTYRCESSFFLYRFIEGILIAGTKIHGITTDGRSFEIEVMDVDTIDSLRRKLERIAAEQVSALLNRQKMIRDGIALPLAPLGCTYTAQVDAEGMSSCPEALLELTTAVELYRGKDREVHTPITKSRSDILPYSEQRDGQEPSIQRFVADLEASLPFLSVVMGSTAKDRQTLYGFIHDGKETGVYQKIRFGPGFYYGRDCMTPAFYALAPITTRLVTREDVEVSVLSGTGTLEESVKASFGDIDMERWTVQFLEDCERLLEADMVVRLCGQCCREYVELLLLQKDLLAKQIPKRLCHVLKPINMEMGEIQQARDVMTDVLRGSLTRGYGKNVLLQYPGEVKTGIAGNEKLYLSGKVRTRQDSGIPIELVPGKLRLKTGKQYLHLMASAERYRNGAFSIQNYTYDIDEMEVVTEEERGYRHSQWLSFCRPVTEENRKTALEVSLHSDIPVPVPYRFYPGQPVLGVQKAEEKALTKETSLEELLFWDYSLTFSHELVGQDRAYITVIFNEKQPAFFSQTEKDLFDYLAQYVFVREQLWTGLTQGDGEVLQNFCNSMCRVAGDIAQNWNKYRDGANSRALAEKTYECNLRMEYGGERLLIFVKTEEAVTPELYFEHKDGTFSKLIQSQVQERNGEWKYALDGVSKGEYDNGVSLKLLLTELDLFTCQSACGKLFISRNEQLTDEMHPVDERFVYRTGDVTFPDAVAAYGQYDNEICLRIPMDYKPEEEFFRRAAEYLFEEILRLPQREGISLNCRISYGYGLNESCKELVTEIPVCMKTRELYCETFCRSLTKTVEEWCRKHEPPKRERFLGVGVTLYSEEKNGEWKPLVGISDIRIREDEKLVGKNW